MNTSRKPHLKSRKGCDQCKRRRVKCNEEKPICATCARLELPCAYIVRKTKLKDNVSDVPRTAVARSWSSVDLELIHHYSTCSCVRFAPHSARYKCWTIDVPRIAFSHPFLLHQILAVAALHQYTTEPSMSSHAHSAMSNRSQALTHVQPVLSSHDPRAGVALFAFAGLTAIYAFGELVLELNDPHATFDTIGQLIACFKLTRGISAMVEAHRKDIESSWAEAMINLNADAAVSRLRSIGLKFDQVHVLEGMIREHAACDEDAVAYTESVHKCMESIQLLLWHQDQDDEIYHLIMTWPNSISERYMQALEKREPIALVILAHFAVLIGMRPKLWWLVAWPNLILRDVSNILGAEWDEHIKWPRMMLEEGLQSH